MTDTIPDKSELLEKCRSIAIKSGEENLRYEHGKLFEFSLQGLTLSYFIGWGGRQYIGVTDSSDKVVLYASDDNKSNSPMTSPITIGEDGFEFIFYQPGDWERRINDVYSVVKNIVII